MPPLWIYIAIAVIMLFLAVIFDQDNDGCKHEWKARKKFYGQVSSIFKHRNGEIDTAAIGYECSKCNARYVKKDSSNIDAAFEVDFQDWIDEPTKQERKD